MIKKILWLTLIISALFMCFSITASAETYTTPDGTATYEIVNGEATMVKCKIPSSYAYMYNEKTPLTISTVYYNGKNIPITKIGTCCFDSSSGVQAVSLTGNVKTIEQYAFRYVKYIRLCKTVQNIHGEAFNTAITKIEVDSTNPYFKSVDGILYNKSGTTLVKYAGAYSNTNTEFTVPATVTEIAPYAFSGRTHLNKITLPETLLTIGEGAFMSCEGLTDINIPNGIKRIENKTFWNVPLSTLELPQGVTYIGEYAFSHSGNANADLIIPDSVTNIARNAFEASKFKSVKLPSNLSTLGYGAFWNCTFTDVTIPASLKTVGEASFRYCQKLEKVTIEKGVETIGRNAFSDCTVLTDIVIPQSVTTINDYAFRNCTALEKAELPDGLTAIADYTYYKCTALKSVTIPKGVTSIGTSAFFGCTALTDVYYDGSPAEWTLVEIGDYNDPLLNANVHYKFNIIFDDGDGTTSVPTYTGEDITITASAPTARPGYEFAGWEASDGTLYQTGDVFTGASGDTTLTAKFNRTIYTETEYKYGGYQIKPTGVPTGSIIIVASTDDDGTQFIDKQVYEGESSITIFGSNATNYKVFVWAGIDNLKPLCEPETH